MLTLKNQYPCQYFSCPSNIQYTELKIPAICYIHNVLRIITNSKRFTKLNKTFLTRNHKVFLLLMNYKTKKIPLQVLYFNSPSKVLCISHRLSNAWIVARNDKSSKIRQVSFFHQQYFYHYLSENHFVPSQ